MNAEDLLYLIAGAIVPSLLVSWLVTGLMRRVAPWLGLIDKPNARKVHAVPIPLGGGIGIFMGVIVPFLAGTLLLVWMSRDGYSAPWIPELVRLHREGLHERLGGLWVLMGCGALLVGLGLVDVRYGLPWQLRSAVEFVLAVFCVLSQGWELTAFIEFGSLSRFASVALSTVWIVVLINSFNMLDNMDGLSGGVAAIASGMLAT